MSPKIIPETHPDLFWASCGGGGGTFGIVTAFTFQISILPNRGRLVGVTVSYAAGNVPFVESHMAFQKWLPTASRLWGIDNADIFPSPQGPVFGFQGVYFGEAVDALQELQDGGVLDNLCMDPARCAFDNVPGYPLGVSMVEYESFYDFYLDTVSKLRIFMHAQSRGLSLVLRSTQELLSRNTTKPTSHSLCRSSSLKSTNSHNLQTTHTTLAASLQLLVPGSTARPRFDYAEPRAKAGGPRQYLERFVGVPLHALCGLGRSYKSVRPNAAARGGCWGGPVPHLHV